MNARHVVWAVAGVVFAPLLLLAGRTPVAVALLVAIAVLFPLWKRYGGREVWVGLALGAAVMCITLSWAAVTGSGCPQGGKVQLSKGKAPVTCRQVRGSYATMAAFFGAVMVIGLAMPVAARRRRTLSGAA